MYVRSCSRSSIRFKLVWDSFTAMLLAVVNMSALVVGGHFLEGAVKTAAWVRTGSLTVNNTRSASRKPEAAVT